MIPGDSAEDGLGVADPGEWLGVIVAGLEVLQGDLLRRRDAGERATVELLLRQVGKDALDPIEPAPLVGVKCRWHSGCRFNQQCAAGAWCVA